MKTHKQLVVRIDPKLYRQFQLHCAKKGLKMSAVIREMISELLGK